MKIAIDLGGTNIRVAQVKQGRCVQKVSVPCRADAEEDVVLHQLFDLIDSMQTDELVGIGVGVPSIVDVKRGIVYDVANISAWKEVHLKAILEQKYQVPVGVNNDTNCFTLGESLFGVGRQYSNFLGITIGTGIGAGLVLNGELYTGEFAGAGEIGSLPYLDSDFEHYCSSFFFKEKCGGTALDLAEKAGSKDAEALAAWKAFGRHLGELVKAILFAYAPEAIVFGGGIWSAYTLFKDGMEESMRTFPYRVILDQLKILSSENPDISLLGASALVSSSP